MSKYYHEFTPTGLDPEFIFSALLGFISIIILSRLIVRIRPINERCRTYHSEGRKAAKISNPKRRCGSAKKDERGLAIIFPSTSCDWKIAFAYVIYVAALALHYHGNGFLQILYNHGYGEGTFFLILLIGCIIATLFVVEVERFAQHLTGLKLYRDTKKETGRKLPVFEEWGLYDRSCRKQYNRIFNSLSKKEREEVRSIIPYWEVSERIRLDRIETYLATKEKQEEMAREAAAKKRTGLETALNSVKQIQYK